MALVETWARVHHHWNPLVRFSIRKKARRAVRDLRRTADPKHLQLFAAFLNFPEPHICGQGARGLGKIGGVEAATILRGHLQQGDSANPAMLAWALGRIRDEESVPILCNLAAQKLPEAIRALGLIGDKTATPVLVQLLKNDDSRDQGVLLRVEIFWALGRIHDVQALPVLEQFLEQYAVRATTETVVWRATFPESLLWALGELGDESTLKLLEALSGTDSLPGYLVTMAVRRLRNRINERRRKQAWEKKQSEQ